MIVFKNVTKKFGTKVVLDNINLYIPKNTITFIIGKSGEGKSVTIKHIMGLLKPDSGSIFFEDQDITKYNTKELLNYRKNFGILFQNAALFDSLTVGENVMFPLNEHTKLSFLDKLKRVEEVLNMVGLPNIQHKYPNQLSTGEKKRVGLARALAAYPKVLLYDEPTTGMDPLISEMIDNLIVQVNKQNPNITTIVISHDLKATLAIAEHIIMLYKGKVQISAAPQELKRTNDAIVKQFFSGKIQGPMEFL